MATVCGRLYDAFADFASSVLKISFTLLTSISLPPQPTPGAKWSEIKREALGWVV